MTKTFSCSDQRLCLNNLRTHKVAALKLLFILFFSTTKTLILISKATQKLFELIYLNVYESLNFESKYLFFKILFHKLIKIKDYFLK